MTLILAVPVTDWYCPECGATDQTRVAGPHDRYHVCPRLRYLSVPMLRAGVAAKIEARDRDDYVGREIAPVDPAGRPIMSIVTTRDDGNDVMVFAPTATARME